MSINIEGNRCPPAGEGGSQSEVFFANLTSGVGIESLVLQDTQLQRKTACMLRKAQRDQRRKLVKESVKKMKEAANSRFGSALLGIGLKIGAAAFESLYGGALEKGLTEKFAKEMSEKAAKEMGERVAKGICKGVSAVAEGLAAYNPLEMDATDKDCQAKLLQDSADGQSDAAKDTTDWLASARELERRAIDHLENVNSTKHKTQLTASGG